MMLNRKEILTVPNALSFYRLVMAPVIVAIALNDERTLFVVLICVSLVTDILDGLIARVWDARTKLGSRLDSIADDLTYVAALVGVFRFQYETLQPHIAILYVFIGFLVLTTLVPLVKFGRTPSFHLYVFKINGYLQGFFLFYLFVIGFNVYFYYLAMGYGILACLVVIAVALIVDCPVSDARGIYWVLRDKDENRTRPHGSR